MCSVIHNAVFNSIFTCKFGRCKLYYDFQILNYTMPLRTAFVQRVEWDSDWLKSGKRWKVEISVHRAAYCTSSLTNTALTVSPLLHQNKHFSSCQKNVYLPNLNCSAFICVNTSCPTVRLCVCASFKTILARGNLWICNIIIHSAESLSTECFKFTFQK